MLAYLFWHRPGSATTAQSYEDRLLAFHASLATRPPDGFLRSVSFAIDRAPWPPEGGPPLAPLYEDWYFVADWAAVGRLNDEAVGAAHGEAHDSIARQSQAGAGGLYACRAGDEAPLGADVTWFAKPRGWGYDALDAAAEPLLDGGATLWRRQMVLGPAPEFCLQGLGGGALPHPVVGRRVARRRVE